MKAKHVNFMIAMSVFFHLAIVFLTIIYRKNHTISLEILLSLGQISLLIPAFILFVIYLFIRKKEEEKESILKIFCFKKIKWSTAIMVVIFTLLIMPLTVVVNSISMFFVDNTMMEMSAMLMDLSFFELLMLVAVVPAILEEIVFRGMVYGSYRRSGYLWTAILISAVVFGLRHMNINQALYASLLGVMMALLVEATGSIWSSVLCHFIINANSSISMYLMERFAAKTFYKEMMNPPKEEELFLILGVYLFISAITTPVAICVLHWLAKNENRELKLRGLKKEKCEKQITAAVIGTGKQSKNSILSLSLWVFFIFTIAYMIAEEFLMLQQMK